ncbi:hypothetical protein GCM10009844_40880 [Nocardioides koreensis]|uniref:DUF222 domain-containing protein n=1 Tax=Nocardioides koreensis TaxID=433651 RepID=A0ABP5M0I6_9ACTN
MDLATAPDALTADAVETLALAERLVVRRRQVELEDLRVAAHWAALHGSDPREDPGFVRGRPGADRLVAVGGEGTPKVRELCFHELGIARQVHAQAARALVADVLDLQHRLPLTWARLEALAADAFVARKVAAKTRDLPRAVVGLVDVAVATVLGRLSAGRVLAIAEAAIIEADTAGHAEKLAAERRRRYVGLSRTDEHGLRTVIARVTAGDAVWIDATVDRVADILTTRPDLRPEDPGADLTRDELRALAFGWLARPAQLLHLLLEAAHTAEQDTQAADETDAAEPEAGADAAESDTAESEAPEDDTDAGPEPEPEPEPPGGDPLAESRSTALSQEALDLFRAADLTTLAPAVQLYVHLHQDVLDGTPGVARVEGIGPHLLEQVVGLVAHTRVTVTPVVDLADRHAVDGYEFPQAVRHRTRLRMPAEAAPHATRITGNSQRIDLDHPTPYDPTGPPKQTGDHNAAPLGRTTHRAKTHLGYRVLQIGVDAWLWRTPHGLWRVVDPRGTHPISDFDAEGFTSPDPLQRSLARLWWEHCASKAA